MTVSLTTSAGFSGVYGTLKIVMNQIKSLVRAAFYAQLTKQNGNWPEVSGHNSEGVNYPSYDVVIPTRDNLATLRLGIQGLENQLVKPSTYVFTTNGSLEYEHQLRKIAPQNSTILRNLNPFNFAESINQSILSAQSEYILLHNDDVVLKSNSVSTLFMDHLSNPRCLCVGAPLHDAKGRLNHFGIRFFDGWYGVNVSKYPTSWKGLCFNVEGVTFGLAMLRRGTLLEAKLDAAFPLGLNDVDFFIRMRGLGEFHLCTLAASDHYMGSTRGTSIQSLGAFLDNLKAVLRLNRKWVSH